MDEIEVIEDIDNNWNKNFDILVRGYGKNAEDYAQIHLNKSSSYSKYNTILHICVMFITFISAMMSLVMASIISFFSDHYNALIPIKDLLTGIILGIATFITGIITVSDFNGKFKRHQEAYHMFNELHHIIQFELAKDVTKRKDAISYVDEITKTFDEIDKQTPDLTQKIIKKYNNKIKKMKKEDKYNTIVDISEDMSIEKKKEVTKKNEDLLKRLNVSSWDEYLLHRYMRA